jgi:hypothetical protein
MRSEVISQFSEGEKQIANELLDRVILKNASNRLAS